MTWSIQTRTVTFDCPALPETIYRGPDRKQHTEPLLTVRSIRGREAVGELFEYTVLAEVEHLDALLRPSEAAQIDLQQVVGTHGIVALEIDGIGTFRAAQKGDTGRANIGADTRYIGGNIATARIICAEDRAAVYEFVLRPSVWWATLERDSRIFKGSVTDILEELLRDRTMLDWRIAGPWSGMRAYPLRDFVRQAWETDWNFALRLMEEWGLFYWFEHNRHGHTLVISDTLGGFRDHGVAYETLLYRTDGRIDEEHISELSVTYTATAGKATVNDHDYMRPRLRKSNAPLREEYEDTQGTANGRIEIYAPAEFAKPDSDDGPHKSNDAREEGQHLARVMLQAVRCEGLRAHGKGRLRGLQPGRTFTLADYPQEAANREYIVLSCELDLNEIGTSSGSWRQYSVDASFELQPSTEVYRLPQVTPRPHVGNEYAVIVTPTHKEDGNYEWWIDDKNRALIQYDWDRQATFDGSTSIWVRLATQWQGNQMGVVTPARAGQMVIVSHVHGDPDRPYISAFVVDKYNLPPWELPHNAAISGTRSQSLGNSSASNHLAFDDTHGKLQAQLASDQEKSSLSLGFNTRIDGNKGRQEARGSGFELRTDGHGAARAAKGLLITTEARPDASGHALDMGETIARLTQARDIHETLAKHAQAHGAQAEEGNHAGNQSNVAKAIKAANDEVRGIGSANAIKNNADAFPELAAPHLTVSSAAGIQATAAGTMHMASGDDLAVTSGRNFSVAAARSMFASVANTFAVFVQKAGIALTAAAGKIRIEAQSDSVQIVAKKDAEILSTDGWINLTGVKGIRLNGGGTVLEISPEGLRGFTHGEFLIHAASHATAEPREKPVKLPLTDIKSAKIAESFTLVDNRSGLRIARQPYRITLEDGQVIKGRTTDAGETALVLAEWVQAATVEILHDDGTENPVAILPVVLTRSADQAQQPTIVSQKKGDSPVNGRELQRNEAGQPGFDWNVALCQPYNWGMRYSTKDKKDSKRLDFPVIRQFALDIREVLLEQIQWGDNYFGRGTPTLTITPIWIDREAVMPNGENRKTRRLQLNDSVLKELSKRIRQVLSMALTSSQSGPFALPSEAMPDVIVTNDALTGDAQGVFDNGIWALSINTATFTPLFQESQKKEALQPKADALEALKDFVDTIYHEARHGQQSFWVFAMMQQQKANFPKTPKIDLWPGIVVRGQREAARIVELAKQQPIPDDMLALAGIKHMAVGLYVWYLGMWKTSKWFPIPIANNDAELSEEYQAAFEQATEVLRNVGAGGAQIDVDNMVYEHTNEGYRGRPWEDDAFYCGENAGDYWMSGEASNDMSDNRCSRAYAFAYHARASRANIPTISTNNTGGGAVRHGE
ncbi:type VI secretion system tip protein TssI/VgrG [Caballeronia sp. LZ029]|uniref:type VI secretion system Vgr family protein n=1 Tax=Caballeronia sp. LZ029 TaxID=3038564 RepID=UPI00285BEAD7|nr:type VI secretion system tip protein TssI/VgrG [Caballeronia sp. LZ029]MDR5748023.1 type VI secretion system tip protein TssI/VgrG [Caballeronia sp. LZ029]